MKIAYSINGEGNGHASRMVALAPGLMRWHSLELFVPASVAGFVAGHLGGCVRHEIPTFLFSKRHDRIIYSRTMWRSLLVLMRGFTGVFRLARQLRSGKFDAVISDFDPFLAWAGRLARLPVLQINHPGVLLKFPRLELQHLAASIVAMIMEGPWTKRLHCSFFHGDIGPILRPELRQAAVSRGDYLLVNLKGGYREAIIAGLQAMQRRDPGLKWRLFPDPQADFAAALAGCRAVISAAGHQMLSEALALGKPVLALPQDGQGEQQLNAAMLVKSGCGMAGRLQDFGQILPVFLAEIDKLAERFTQPLPRRFCFRDCTEEVVFQITRVLLPRRERRQAITHLSVQELGIPVEFRDAVPGSLAGDALNVTVIGSGYVGLLAAAGMADWGHFCIGVDLDARKVEKLARGESPIFEPGLAEILKRNLACGQLRFTTALEPAVAKADVIMICVGTPPASDGSADLTALFRVADSIADILARRKGVAASRSQPLAVIIKSTVPVGTNRMVQDLIAARGRLVPGRDFELVSNPEFLREGRAVADFFNPERTVLGINHPESRAILEQLYQQLSAQGSPLVFCNPESAELAKYAANAFLATKISFINQMANLAEACGADVATVAQIMGMDSRIGKQFLQAGPGYGGSCFPKDTQALSRIGRQYRVDLDVVDATIAANDKQATRMLAKLLDLARCSNLSNLAGRRVAMLGLAFKAQTDDIRESPAIPLVTALVAAGVRLVVHDPQAMANFASQFPAGKDMIYAANAEAALRAADLAIIVTDWEEYRSLEPGRIAAWMSRPLVLDTRNILDPQAAAAAGLALSSVGRRNPQRIKFKSFRRLRRHPSTLIDG